jgi:hypothetical protein
VNRPPQADRVESSAWSLPPSLARKRHPESAGLGLTQWGLPPLHLPEQSEHDSPRRLVLLYVDQQLAKLPRFWGTPERAELRPGGLLMLGGGVADTAP